MVSESLLRHHSGRKVSLGCLHIASLISAAFVSPALAQKKVEFKTEEEKVSYILGHQMGSNFKRNSIEVNPKIFTEGLADALAGNKSQIPPDQTQKSLEAFQKTVEAKNASKSKEAGEAGKSFLVENKKRKGVITTTSGLQYEIVTAGKGAKPKATETVTVHYKGTLLDGFDKTKREFKDGQEFDSSYSRGEPATFPVNQVIPGWTEALQLMPVGSKWRLYIPPEIGYGAQGAPPKIGPNQVLIFDVELKDIKAAAAKTPPVPSKSLPAAEPAKK